MRALAFFEASAWTGQGLSEALRQIATAAVDRALLEESKQGAAAPPGDPRKCC
jgi:hypothetical protein